MALDSPKDGPLHHKRRSAEYLDVSSSSGDDDSEEELWERPNGKRRTMRSHSKDDDDDSGGSNKGVILVVALLMIALVCAGGYFLMNPSGTDDVAADSSGGNTGGAATGPPTAGTAGGIGSTASSPTATATSKTSTDTTTGTQGTNDATGNVTTSIDKTTTAAKVTDKDNTTTTPDQTTVLQTLVVTPVTDTLQPEKTETPPVPKKQQPSLELWKERVLAGHNTIREVHHAPPLEYDDGLASKATEWAETCSDTPTRATLGGNLHVFNPAKPDLIDPVEAIWTWASEEKDYYYSLAMPSDETRQFTQVVWVATKKVGCALKQCPDTTLVTCLYDPEGNDMGEFEDNVKMPDGGNVAHPE